MRPFKFKYNRVWRVYEGGLLIDKLRHSDHPEDGYFPEDWVASVVEANNVQNDVENEGISTALVNNQEILFNDLIREYPQELLGETHFEKYGANTGFLTKLLDSAIRLPLQAHPDRQQAKTIYNSDFGKTETWIVLDTRPINGEEPYLILGFNDKLDKDVFVEEGLCGDMTRSLEMVHKHPVKAGDILLLKGGTVHAIGPGVFLVEIMEPTDLVTQPELKCGNMTLTQSDRFGNASPEDGMKIFHFIPKSKDQAWNDAAIQPTLIDQSDDFKLEMLLDRQQIKFFGGKKLTIHGEWHYNNLEKSFCCGIVTKGSITLESDTKLNLKQGDTFFMPYSVNNCNFCGNGEVIFAYPPV